MILSRNPQGLITKHTMITDHDIFNGCDQRMPNMQRSSDIRRRHADNKRSAGWVQTRLEVTVRLPPGIEPLLRCLGIIGLWNLFESPLPGFYLLLGCHISLLENKKAFLAKDEE